MFLRCIFVFSFFIIISNFTILHAEGEPNNTPEQANSLALNGSDAGALNYDNDIVDWWKVDVPSEGKLVIATLSNPELEIDNFIYDQDKESQIASYAYGGSHEWDTTYFVNLLPGTYYIKTLCYFGTGTYSITNKFTPADYQNDPENNDSAQVASALSLNGNSTGHLGYYSMGYTDLQDWWKVTVPLDGKLVIATYSDPELEIDNFIYDQDRKSQIASYAYGGSHEWDTTYFVNLVPGTYYIKSLCYFGYGAYTISNKFIPANFQNDYEANDSAAIALEFELNSSSTGHLGFYSLGVTDINDWRKISVQSDGKLIVATLSDPTIEIDNFIYDQDKTTQIASYAYGGSHDWDTTYFNNLTPGTYYIKTSDYVGYGAYSISNKFIPALYDNDLESNDSIPVAKNIALHTVSSGHLGYYNQGIYDINDYYTFNATSIWDSLFIRTDSSPTIDIDINLYDNLHNQIFHSGAYGTTELLIFTNLQPGTYYVCASRYVGFGSYKIIITNSRPSNPLMDIGSNKLVDFIPNEFELLQNYPNPFNPQTTIRYAIPEQSNIKIEIFNMLGQSVEVLVNQNKSAGVYETTWNAANLPSGIYLISIKAYGLSSKKNFTQIKKALLLK